MKQLLIFILILTLISCKETRKLSSVGSNITSDSLVTNDTSLSIIANDIIVTSAYLRVEEPIKALNLSPTLKIIKITNNSISNTTLNRGSLVYKIPNEMKVRNTYQVMVRIGKSSVNIHEELNGEVKETTIPVTELMEVRLIDPSPADAKVFDIVKDNNEVQILDLGYSFTQWTWNVTPLKTGNAQLKLVISIIKDGNKKETVYQDTVKVKTDISKQIPFFFGKYWQWILSTLIIPFGIWYYNRNKKKKK